MSPDVYVHDLDVPEDEGDVWGARPRCLTPVGTRTNRAMGPSLAKPGRSSASARSGAPAFLPFDGVIDSEAAALASLRDVLRSVDFGGERLEALIRYAEGVAHPELRATARRLVLEEDADEREALVVRLFHGGEAAPAARVTELFGRLDLRGLAALGLVRLEDGEVRPLVRISAVDGVLVMHDADYASHDCVVGPTGSSRISAACTPRHAAERALDLGAGCGIQALLLARHTEHVVATDISARALRFTALNARLNDMRNIETRQGSFFEPARGERFDLVAANPPYVISPDVRFTYRDARPDDDELSRSILSQLPGYLREGGTAAMQGNWIHRSDQRWFETPGSCLADAGCDSLLLRFNVREPLVYALFWAQGDHGRDTRAFESTVSRWHESYRAAGIQRISTGMVIVRRRSVSANWHRAVSALGTVSPALGEALPAIFVTQDRFADFDGDSLLAAHLRPSAGLRIETPVSFDQQRRALVLCEAALGGRRAVSPAVAACLLRLDGCVSVRDALRATTAERDDALRELRGLLMLGYVYPT